MEKEKKKLLVANWKMNPVSLKEAETLFKKIAKRTRPFKNTGVVICPPFLYLPRLLSQISHFPSHICLGAQNCFWKKKGAYTGEISPLMLKNLGCEYVIVGHSERRKYFGETDDAIRNKLKAVLKAGLTPILCIGETKRQRERQGPKKVINSQLEVLPQNPQFITAYEPRWAIGSGETPDPEQAGRIAEFIKKGVGGRNPVLYGGSVKANNATDFIKAGFDGLLAGGASLDAEEFGKIAALLES